VIIDVHAHALDEAFLEGLSRSSKFGLSAGRDAKGRYYVCRGDGPRISLDNALSDIPARVESLTRRNVVLQLIGPPPGFTSLPGGAANVDYARALNEHGARVVKQGSGRLELMLALSLGEPERCAYELERGVDRYGARSALLPTTAGGRPLEDGRYDELFRTAEKLGILFFLHPVSPEPAARFPVYTLQVLVQWPFETTLAVSRMIFDGFFDHFPALKILVAHGGGGLAFLKGRLDSAFEARGAEGVPYFTAKISHPPSSYLKQLYYDTCSQSAASVQLTIDAAGADRVMFGTDCPFEIGDADGMRAAPAIDSLSAETREQIYHGNAARVLNMGRG
jgi:aminocarboxymuconate-semialdehyde decarboxylase